MTHLEFFGGWYVDALPTGERAVLFPLSKTVATHIGRLPTNHGTDYPLFLTITNVGGFKVAGKGHESVTTWEWIGGVVWLPRDEAVGNFSVIYDQAGVLHISKGGAVGSQGWRYVAPNGDLVTGDATGGPVNGLNEWTDLSPLQDKSLMIGQGHEGGVHVWDGSVVRRLFPGACYSVHAHPLGDDVCVSFYDVAPDGLTAHILHVTVAELRALPLASTPVEVPVKSDRFWFQPNLASQDLVKLFDDPATLAPIETFCLYIQAIIFDGAEQGPNTWQALQANHVYQKLKQAGIPLSIEMGSVKPGDCQCVNALKNLEWAVGLVREQKGEVTYVSMDEPLTANIDSCHLTIDQVVDSVAAFVHKGTALGVQVGWIEAWPHVDFATQQSFLAKLKARDAVPAFWHLDIDWVTAAREKHDVAPLLAEAQRVADAYGIPLGIYLNATIDPLLTDAAHFTNVLALAQKVHGLMPNATRLIVASWAFRKPANLGGLQDVPNNLGASGLLALYSQVQGVFAGAGADVPPPPPPPPEGHPMLSTFTDPQKETIAVKEIKPVVDTNLVTWILPNGRVYSCQPDGSYGERDPGTEGGYEKCRMQGGVGHFKPADGIYFTKAYALVDGL